jgi:hypothetical protein
MATELQNYMVRCDPATAELLRSEIEKVTRAEPRQSDIKGIGGSTELILFGTAALGAIKALLDVIKASIETGRAIKGIKIGDREVNNPTVTQITELQRQAGDAR